jgi:hypothetical protein
VSMPYVRHFLAPEKNGINPPRTLHGGEKKRGEQELQAEGDMERTKRMKIGYEQKAGDKSVPFDDVLEPIINGLVCYIKASLKHFTARDGLNWSPEVAKIAKNAVGRKSRKSNAPWLSGLPLVEWSALLCKRYMKPI